MLASDLGLDLSLPGDTSDAPVGDGVGVVMSVATAGTLNESPAEGENTPAVDLVAFAKALAAKPGVALYGAAWCPTCTVQKELFEDGADFLPFIEVTNPDGSPNPDFAGENIPGYPTWKFPDDTTEPQAGFLSLEAISARAGIAIPTSVNPFVAPIADLVAADPTAPAGSPERIGNPLYIGSPMHIALDGYDPNGGPLTYSVVSSNPSIVQPTLLSENPSVRVSVAGWGDMVFQLFQGRVPNATQRFISLVESGFYNAANNDPDITLHRVIDNFMLQFGIPNPIGGASSPETFDDEFHPDLQHNTKGALSWAKTTQDDSATSQVFVTDAPTRHLDFNHPYFGQLTEGDKVRDAITMVATDGDDVPVFPIRISSVSMIEDTENAVVMLKAMEGATGSADITVTVTDEDGNSYVETFNVAVAADPFNGGPFLGVIPTVQTTMDTAATFQLSAIDVEGDAVLYRWCPRRAR